MMILFKKPELLILVCMGTVWMFVFLYIALDGSLSETGFQEYFIRNKNEYKELDRRLWGSLTRKRLKAYEREILFAKLKMDHKLKIAIPKELVRAVDKEHITELEGDRKDIFKTGTRRKSSWRARFNRKKIIADGLNYKPVSRSHVTHLWEKDLTGFASRDNVIKVMSNKFPIATEPIRSTSFQRGLKKRPHSKASKEKYTSTVASTKSRLEQGMRLELTKSEVALPTQRIITGRVNNKIIGSTVFTHKIKRKSTIKFREERIKDGNNLSKSTPSNYNKESSRERNLTELATKSFEDYENDHFEGKTLIHRGTVKAPVITETKTNIISDSKSDTVKTGNVEKFKVVANNNALEVKHLDSDTPPRATVLLEKKSIDQKSQTIAILTSTPKPKSHKNVKTVLLTVPMKTTKVINTSTKQKWTVQETVKAKVLKTTLVTKHSKIREGVSAVLISKTDVVQLQSVSNVLTTKKSNLADSQNKEGINLALAYTPPKGRSSLENSTKDDMTNDSKEIVGTIENNMKNDKVVLEKTSISPGTSKSSKDSSAVPSAVNRVSTLNTDIREGIMRSKDQKIIINKGQKEVGIKKESTNSDTVGKIRRVGELAGGDIDLKKDIQGTTMSSKTTPSSAGKGASVSIYTNVSKSSNKRENELSNTGEVVARPPRHGLTNDVHNGRELNSSSFKSGRNKNVNNEAMKVIDNRKDGNKGDNREQKTVKDSSHKGVSPTAILRTDKGIVNRKRVASDGRLSPGVASSPSSTLQESSREAVRPKHVNSDLLVSIDQVSTNPLIIATTKITTATEKPSEKDLREMRDEKSTDAAIPLRAGPIAQIVKKESKLVSRNNTSKHRVAKPVLKTSKERKVRKTKDSKKKKNSLLRAVKLNL